MLAGFLSDPWVHGIALLLGTVVGFGELFLRGKRVPAPTRQIIKRGEPARFVFLAFGCCLVYAGAMAIYLFGADGEKQYFLAAGAAVQTLANVLR